MRGTGTWAQGVGVGERCVGQVVGLNEEVGGLMLMF